ncbi:MAG: hypothetical protein ACI9M1_001182 [Porticoccaceae bacterium]|jgi:hypothetical protein
MKSKLFLLSFLMLFTFTTNYAQTSASQSGIAVQGIARNSNNTALTSQSISFSFELYYKDSNGNSETIGSIETISLMTDAFGVFSHVIDPLAVNSSKFSNYQVYLKISTGTQEISNEMLKHVPYAIAANNGVPAGSIMPYVGAEAPVGWLLCNGSDVPNPSALYTLIGAKTPKLGGMFLRGAGTNDYTAVVTTINEIQDDSFQKHRHDVSLKAEPNHKHNTEALGGNLSVMNVTSNDFHAQSVLDKFMRNVQSDAAGGHNHTVTEVEKGSDETRPVNYGVNYIIKL